MLDKVTCRNLQRLRESKGYKIKDVAKSLGINPNQYATYEKGEANPQARTLCELADFFGVSIDTLLGREAIYKESPEEAISKKYQLSKLEQAIFFSVLELPKDERKKAIAHLISED